MRKSASKGGAPRATMLGKLQPRASPNRSPSRHTQRRASNARHSGSVAASRRNSVVVGDAPPSTKVNMHKVADKLPTPSPPAYATVLKPYAGDTFGQRGRRSTQSRIYRLHMGTEKLAVGPTVDEQGISAGGVGLRGADGGKAGKGAGSPTVPPHVAGRADLSSDLGATKEPGTPSRAAKRNASVEAAKIKAMRRCAAALSSLTWKADAVEAPSERQGETSPVKSFASAGRAVAAIRRLSGVMSPTQAQSDPSEAAVGDMTIARLVDEDAVAAIHHIAMLEDTDARLQCATALTNLTSKGAADPYLLRRMLDQKLIKTLVLLTTNTHPRILQDCVAALCFLTGSRGLEDRVLAEGCMTMMTNAINAGQSAGGMGNWDTHTLIATTLLNLSAIPHRTDVVSKLETLTETIIGAVESAVDSATEEICLRALCNVCAHKHTQSKVVDQGAIRVLVRLACSDAPKTRFLSALALALLCECKAGRRAMMELRASRTIITLSSSPGEDTRVQCAIALGLLCSETGINGNMHRTALIGEGTARALIDLANLPVPRVRAGCTEALVRLCSVTACHGQLTKDGILPSVSWLVGRSMSYSPPDYVMSQNCALIIANLLHNVCTHEEALSQDVIPVLCRLAKTSDERTRECAALAFFNLSADQASCAKMMDCGAADALIQLLGTAESLGTKKMTAATISNMTAADCNMEDTLARASNAIAPLTHLMEEGEAECSAAAVFNLAAQLGHARELMRHGVVKSLVELCRSETKLDRRLAVSVLCRLTMHAVLRTEVLVPGLPAVLIDLASESDSDMKHRAAVTLSNLAAEPSTRVALVEAGVVQALVSLSTVHNEEIRQGCASTLCNLAANERIREMLVQQGAVKALVILGMVASSSRDTALLCAQGLFNCLQVKDVETALKDGALYALAALTKSGDMDMRTMCSIALRKMSYLRKAIEMLTSPAVLSTLVKLAVTDQRECQRNCARALFNLARQPELRSLLTNAGAVSVFKTLSGTEDILVAEQCVSGIAMLSSHPMSRVQIVEQRADAIIFDSYTEGAGEECGWPSDEMEFGAVLTLYNLSWHEETRRVVMSRGAAQAITQLLRSDDEETRRIALQSLHNLAVDPENIPLLMGNKVSGGQASADVLDPVRYLVCEMAVCTHFKPDSFALQLCAHVILNVSTNASTHVALVAHGVSHILATMYSLCDGTSGGGDVACNADTVEKIGQSLINILASKVNTAQVVREGAGSILLKYTVRQKFDAGGMGRRKSLTHGAEHHLSVEKKQLRRRISSCIRNLLSAAGNAVPLSKVKLIPVLVDFAQSSDKLVVEHATGALVSLSRNEDLKRLVFDNPLAKKVISESFANADSLLAKHAPFLNATLLAEIEQEAWSTGGRSGSRLLRAEPHELSGICTDLRMTEANAPHLDIQEDPKKVEADEATEGSAWFSVAAKFRMQPRSLPETRMKARVAGESELPPAPANRRPTAELVFRKVPFPSSITLMSKRDHEMQLDVPSEKRKGQVTTKSGKALKRENALSGWLMGQLLRQHEKHYRLPRLHARLKKEKELEDLSRSAEKWKAEHAPDGPAKPASKPAVPALARKKTGRKKRPSLAVVAMAEKGTRYRPIRRATSVVGVMNADAAAAAAARSPDSDSRPIPQTRSPDGKRARRRASAFGSPKATKSNRNRRIRASGSCEFAAFHDVDNTPKLESAQLAELRSPSTRRMNKVRRSLPNVSEYEKMPDTARD